MVETSNTYQDKEEVASQNAVEEKERKFVCSLRFVQLFFFNQPNKLLFRYQREELKKKDLMKKREEDFEDSKKILDEENRKEKERLTLSHQWELERRLRETEMLRSLEELRKQAKTREMKSFRENLNLQRVKT